MLNDDKADRAGVVVAAGVVVVSERLPRFTRAVDEASLFDDAFSGESPFDGFVAAVDGARGAMGERRGVTCKLMAGVKSHNERGGGRKGYIMKKNKI